MCIASPTLLFNVLPFTERRALFGFSGYFVLLLFFYIYCVGTLLGRSQGDTADHEVFVISKVLPRQGPFYKTFTKHTHTITHVCPSLSPSLPGSEQSYLFSAAVVFIKVLDVNDNAPALASDYRPYICEGTPAGEVHV